MTVTKFRELSALHNFNRLGAHLSLIRLDRRNRKYRASCKKQPLRLVVQSKEGGMYVPSDSFSGLSPERKAAQAMVAFFTFVAARVVLAQLEGSGRAALGSYNAKASEDLKGLLYDMPVRDGDAWLEAVMQKNEMLGVRLMEVRAAYAEEDFEWRNMEKIAVKELQDRNTGLMRKHAAASMEKAFQAQSSTEKDRGRSAS